MGAVSAGDATWRRAGGGIPFTGFRRVGTVAEIMESGGSPPNCTSCHMPAVERPLVAGGAARPSRMHLFRGGHDSETVRQALAVDVEMSTTGSDERTATVGVRNTGAAHYLPTGVPDRHLTVEFRLLGEDGRLLEERTHRLKRTIMWRPFIVDLWDTRLPSGARRAYTFAVDMAADPGAGLAGHHSSLSLTRRGAPKTNRLRE